MAESAGFLYNWRNSKVIALTRFIPGIIVKGTVLWITLSVSLSNPTRTVIEDLRMSIIELGDTPRVV